MNECENYVRELVLDSLSDAPATLAVAVTGTATDRELITSIVELCDAQNEALVFLARALDRVNAAVDELNGFAQ